MRRALRCFSSALVFASIFLGVAAPARADDDAALAEAQARFKEGLDLVDGGDHEAARLKFQQAWAVFKSPAVLYNLARTEQLTGHDLQAFEHFRAFLDLGPDPKVTSTHREKALENLQALAAQIGQIEVDVPANARVTLDGVVVTDAARKSIPVKPGRHVVEATLEGRIESVTVDAAAGVTTRTKIDLRPTAAATPSERPEAERPRETSTARIVVPLAIGAAGVAALGVGLGFAIASQSAKDEEDALRVQGVCASTSSPECQALEEKRSEVTAKGTVATIGYIGGGVLVAAAAVTYFVWPSPPKSGSRVMVSPTASGGMIHLGGRF